MRLHKNRYHQILGFLLAGLTGFTIEAGIIHFMINNFSINALAPRLLSFPIAVIATWLINSRFTFKQQSVLSFSEFFRYLNSTVVAQLSNFISYGLLVYYFPMISVLIALIIASLLAMNVSFFLYLKYVFQNN